MPGYGRAFFMLAVAGLCPYLCSMWRSYVISLSFTVVYLLTMFRDFAQAVQCLPRRPLCLSPASAWLCLPLPFSRSAVPVPYVGKSL